MATDLARRASEAGLYKASSDCYSLIEDEGRNVGLSDDSEHIDIVLSRLRELSTSRYPPAWRGLDGDCASDSLVLMDELWLAVDSEGFSHVIPTESEAEGSSMTPTLRISRMSDLLVRTLASRSADGRKIHNRTVSLEAVKWATRKIVEKRIPVSRSSEYTCWVPEELLVDEGGFQVDFPGIFCGDNDSRYRSKGRKREYGSLGLQKSQ